MPKVKSNRGARKRFKLTGNNKVKRRKMNRRHILTSKSSKRKRRLRKSTLIPVTELKRIREML